MERESKETDYLLSPRTPRNIFPSPNDFSLTSLRYKNQNYLSTSALLKIARDLNYQKTSGRLSRSSSVASDLTPSELNPIKGQRRALYSSLPFLTTFGMTHREHEVVNLLKSMQELKIPEKTILTPSLLLATLVAIITQFVVGYNISVLNAPECFIFKGHSTREWSVTVSSLAIGAPFGAYGCGHLANYHGRRSCILLACWVLIFGGLLMWFSPSIEFLAIARFAIGFATGLSFVVVPVYLGEIAPPTLRGTLGTWTQFSLVIGHLIAPVLAYPFGNSYAWRYLFALTPVLAIVALALSSYLVESPRWLLLQNKNSTRAREVIKLLRGYRSDSDVETEIDSLLYAGIYQDSLGYQAETVTSQVHNQLLKTVLSLQFFQQLSGINAVFYYSSIIFKGVIKSPLLGTVLIAVVNVIGTYIALILMEQTSRRLLLQISLGGMFFSLIFVILSMEHILPGPIALLSLILFVLFFEIGLGPIPWLIVAETFDVRSVAFAMSLACIINWVCNFFVSLIFPSLFESLHSLCFIPFAIILMVAFLLITLYLPETLGKTVEEIQQMIQAGQDYQKNLEETVISNEDEFEEQEEF